MRVITFPSITKRREKFVGQKDLRLIIQQPNRLDGSLLESSNSGGLPFDDPVQWGPNGASLAKETYEEAYICNSFDRIACVGANEIVTQGRDRPC
jgi:hypothetical protein